MDIEPHIVATIDKLTDEQVRALAAEMLQRLMTLEGSAWTLTLFPVLEKGFVWPTHRNWPPADQMYEGQL